MQKKKEKGDRQVCLQELCPPENRDLVKDKILTIN